MQYRFRNLVIGVKNSGELGDCDYVNHSCDPNSGIKGQIILVAMKDIEKGEEIAFDYGTVLFKEQNAPEYKFKCLCKSKECRGYVTNLDWQIPKLQVKYKSYFPYYIQESIEKHKL